jgi:hypothetical protein
LLKQPAKSVSEGRDLTPENDFPVEDAAEQLAAKLFPRSNKKRKLFYRGLQEMYQAARNQDVLVIQSPGGWGNTHYQEGLQGWERSIVTGVTATIEKLGYSCIMRQYFRCDDALWGGKNWFREGDFFFFGKSFRACVLAEELKLIIENLPELRIIMVGASQGAAFNNMVTMQLGNTERIYSIELGTFFAHMRRRQLTKRNLAVDSNGLMSDPMCHRDLWKGTKAYFRAFVVWLKYRALGKKVKFTNCINTPGHEYQWEYPEVQGRITAFLTAVLGEKH